MEEKKQNKTNKLFDKLKEGLKNTFPTADPKAEMTTSEKKKQDLIKAVEKIQEEFNEYWEK